MLRNKFGTVKIEILTPVEVFQQAKTSFLIKKSHKQVGTENSLCFYSKAGGDCVIFPLAEV